MEPFWDQTYRDDSASAFGADPSAEVVEIVPLLPAGASVLDMGCGEGRNALFLARAGFSVDAFDISQPGIEKLARIAEGRDLAINAWVEDMREFTFRRSYDCIISHGVLHLLTRDGWARIIGDMKKHTRPGGVNVVAVFTDLLPAPEDLAPFINGLFKEGELARIYSDWRLDLDTAYLKRDHHPNGIHHTHPINKIVAWRPAS